MENNALKLHGQFDLAIINRDWKSALRLCGKLQQLINPDEPVDIEKSRVVVRFYADSIHGLDAPI